MSQRYNHKIAESKWQKRWQEAGIFKVEKIITDVHYFLNKGKEYAQDAKKCLKIRSLKNSTQVSDSLKAAASLYNKAADSVAWAFHTGERLLNKQDKQYLKDLSAVYKAEEERVRKEAKEWLSIIEKGKAAFKNKVYSLLEEGAFLLDQGRVQSAQLVYLQLFYALEGHKEFKKEQEEIQEILSNLELPEITLFTSTDEETRRKLFFTPDLFLKSLLLEDNIEGVTPLDGGVKRKDGKYTLYTEQFYRFLMRGKSPPEALTVKVYEEENLIYEEAVLLPQKNTLSWERHLLHDGLVFIPDTKLQRDFGLDLRINLSPEKPSDLIISQRGAYSGYTYSFSLNEESPLYTTTLSEPPPWQLGCLKKANLPPSARLVDNPDPQPLSLLYKEKKATSQKLPEIDALVEKLHKDPIAIASYVQNEIALVEPFFVSLSGTFRTPPPVQRSPTRTLLEKQGTSLEQCFLLVRLLERAGYTANVATNSLLVLPKEYAENLFSKKFPQDDKNIQLYYPFVFLKEDERLITLFPWMQEVICHEGHDVYGLLPDAYASADKWIL